MTSTKLSLSKKIGYSLGGVEIAPYNLFYIYYLFFLTDIAGIPPKIAAIIPLVAVLWDAITDPWVGMVSDNLRSKYGRRRPVMLISIVPFVFSVYMMWTTPQLGMTGKIIYFIGFSMLYWAATTAWHIPHLSLGAEMTKDYSERTTLQSYRTAIHTASGMLAGALPIGIATFFAGESGDLQKGWSLTALVFAVASGLIMFICLAMTRNTERTDIVEDTHKMNIVQRIVFALKIKQFRLIASTWFMCIFANSLSGSAVVYFLIYYLKFQGSQISLFIIFATVGIAWTPFIKIIANKIEKKKAYILFITCGCMLNNIGLLFITPETPTYLIYGLAFIYAGGNAAFWTLIWSMCFDVTAIDELRTGKRREGLYVGVLSFFQKVSAAICLSLGGFILGVFGYVAGAPDQTPSAILGIKMNIAIIPLVVFSLTIILILFFKLDKKRYEEIHDAIERKKAGEEVDVEAVLEGL